MIEDDPDLTITCGICDGTFGEELAQPGYAAEWIECSNCLKSFHYECVGLDEEPEHALWYCSGCHEARIADQ